MTVGRARTRFVGRVGEREQLDGLVVPGALVTFVGPGGVGKTRLAFEAADTAADRFPDGVSTVALAGYSRDDAPAAIARALGAAGPDPNAIAAAASAQRALLTPCEMAPGEDNSWDTVP